RCAGQQHIPFAGGNTCFGRAGHVLRHHGAAGDGAADHPCASGGNLLHRRAAASVGGAMRHALRLLNGPHDIGRGPIFWIAMALLAAGFLAYPTVASAFTATNTAYYLLNIPMALGLSLLWGYGGVLSFGQVAFFGIAG